MKADNSWNHAKKRREEVKGICSFSFILFFGSSRERAEERGFSIVPNQHLLLSQNMTERSEFYFFSLWTFATFFCTWKQTAVSFKLFSLCFLCALFFLLSASLCQKSAHNEPWQGKGRRRRRPRHPKRVSFAFLHEQNALLILFSCSIRLTSDFVRTLITSVESGADCSFPPPANSLIFSSLASSWGGEI